ncbi:MAG: ABC transporter permease [Verrucomicrobiota bacterium]
MVRFLFNRLIQAIIVLLCIVTVTFFLIRAVPGSPFQEERAIPAHLVAEMEAKFGLDQPWPVQLFKYYGRCLTFFHEVDSMSNSGFTIRELIASSFPISFRIAMGGLLIALVVGLPLGVMAAARKNTWMDYGFMSLALVGICLPTLVIGPVLSQWIGIQLGWFDAAGWWGPGSWFLPAVTLGLFYAGYFARLTRGGMLDVLNQDFVRTARAKGLPEWRILVVHTLKGGLLPSVTFMGPAIAGLIGGSFVVEKIFAVPGQGILFLNAIVNRDHFLIMGCVLVYGILILFMNLVVDLAQVAMNPRLRGETQKTSD